MTRQRYAQLTKIGEASLSRWERGASIQSGALDQLMYLLGFADNTQRLLDREISQSSNPASDNLADLTSRFPNLKNLDVKRVEATHFRLRAGAR
ncbi:MAG TPA: hypothetical protein VHT03_02475 [Rhizomicrobium sp.]|nr:hypothetical protein [Rhizomicrobium sp.]